jgi:hypothetical protein
MTSVYGPVPDQRYPAKTSSSYFRPPDASDLSEKAAENFKLQTLRLIPSSSLNLNDLPENRASNATIRFLAMSEKRQGATANLKSEQIRRARSWDRRLVMLFAAALAQKIRSAAVVRNFWGCFLSTYPPGHALPPGWEMSSLAARIRQTNLIRIAEQPWRKLI